jgi:hypothetical protein
MNNWCICLFFTHIFTEDFNYKGLTARRFYKSFGVKVLNFYTTVSYSTEGAYISHMTSTLHFTHDQYLTFHTRPVPYISHTTSNLHFTHDQYLTFHTRPVPLKYHI